MRAILAGLVAILVLSFFSTAAVQVTGDEWPGGGYKTPAIQVAGDEWPGGG